MITLLLGMLLGGLITCIVVYFLIPILTVAAIEKFFNILSGKNNEQK
jgi:hypothetical protein